MGYVACMDTAQAIGSVDECLEATPQENVGEAPVELPEAPERLYVIRVRGPVVPSDPDLAAAMEEVHEAVMRDPNRWHNNPEKKREALEGLGRLLDEWQAENGAFTEEERARARELLYGP